MKKPVVYIIAFLAALAVLALLLTADNRAEEVFDTRITLRKKDKIPYGASIAYEGLQQIFPNASISINKKEPGNWDSLSVYNSGQALLIISPQFNADEYEMKKLIRFVESGNDVFISTRSISYDAEKIMGIETSPVSTSAITYNSKGEKVIDSLTLRLSVPPFRDGHWYSYKGDKFSAWIYQKDSSVTTVLGSDEMGRANFIQLRAGSGNLYLHMAPLAFSNYFLLKHGNMRYYEHMLSVIPASATRVVWDEYYLSKRFSYTDSDSNRSSWLNVLFRYPGLKWALLTAILGLLLFVLLEMRRKQRYIPVMKKPGNDSLEFVKTIGRLYFDKGDHVNLCRKMSAFFLEHVRNKYKLATGMLDETFVRNLQFRSGYDEKELNSIISFIRHLDGTTRLSEKQVADFHRKLEQFYKQT